MGKKSSKSKTETTLPSWASGLAQQGGNMIMDTVSGNQGSLQNLSNQVGGYAGQLGEMAFGEQPGLQQAQGFIADTLGGQYLDNNPYIDEMAGRAGESAANRVNSTFSTAGRTGGGNHSESLARGVADAENNLRYTAYAGERQNQNQALGMLPSMTAAQYAGVPSYLGAAQTAGQLPYSGVNALSSMGNLWGGQGTTTSQQPGGWGTQLLGAAASALPFVLSDRRTKADIEVLGDWDSRGDGLKRYAFRYKWEPVGTRHEGVMADEVRELRPQAYLKGFVNGEYDGVNYAALGGAE